MSSAATIWQLRALSGWLPPTSTGLARAFAAPVEIAQIEHHLARLDRPGDIRAGVATPVPLGSLGTAMPRAARATTSDQVRDVLARSAWGDPGGNDRVTIGLGLRVAWARRLLRQAPAATEWVLGAAAVLIARERFVFDRDIPEIPARGLDQLLEPGGTAPRPARNSPITCRSRRRGRFSPSPSHRIRRRICGARSSP